MLQYITVMIVITIMAFHSFQKSSINAPFFFLNVENVQLFLLYFFQYLLDTHNHYQIFFHFKHWIALYSSNQVDFKLIFILCSKIMKVIQLLYSQNRHYEYSTQTDLSLVFSV